MRGPTYINNLILRICQVLHRRRGPRIHKVPGAGPRVALYKDPLRCRPRRADAVDGGLIQPGHECVVHVVVLVVGVEDNLVVALEAGRDRGPPCLEARGVGYDLVVVAACVFVVNTTRYQSSLFQCAE